MIGPNNCPNVPELPSVPIKLTDVPLKLIEGLESALEHCNSAEITVMSTLSATVLVKKPDCSPIFCVD